MKLFLLLIIIVPIIVAFYLISCNSKPQNGIREIKDSIQEIRETKVEKNYYTELRKLALNMTSKDLNFSISGKETKIYGVVMDWNIGEGIVTISSFITGDASMYTSTGTSIIGGIAHENVKQASKAFVNKTQNYLVMAVKTDTTSMPSTHGIKFYFLTNKGRYVMEDQMSNIENGSSRLLELFNDCNALISEIRKSAGG